MRRLVIALCLLTACAGSDESPSPSTATETPSAAPTPTGPAATQTHEGSQTQAPGTPAPEQTPAPATETPTVQPPTPTPTQALPVTWYREIEPVLQRVCQRCHVDGGVAPRPLTTYEEVAPVASLVAAFVESGLMPPAAPDPACRDYEGSERQVLIGDERALFSAWAAAGAPRGQASEAPPPVEPAAGLVDPDLVLYPPVAHTPYFDAGGNEYYCFVLETGLTETAFATGFDALIDKSEIVHHIVLFKDGNGDAGQGVDGNPADGFPCYDMESDWQFVSAWAPGAGALVFNDDVGLRLEPSDQLVMQLHYFESSPGAGLVSDKTGYALKTSRRVRRELQMVEFGPTNFTIPAGDSAYELLYSWTAPDDLDIALDVYAVGPHMHLLGSSYRGWIDHKDGSQSCVVESDGWDFSNQGVYALNTPVSVRPGDTINWQCTWNNSASNPEQLFSPPQDVRYGLGTDDEMCFVFSYSAILPVAP